MNQKSYYGQQQLRQQREQPPRDDRFVMIREADYQRLMNHDQYRPPMRGGAPRGRGNYRGNFRPRDFHPPPYVERERRQQRPTHQRRGPSPYTRKSPLRRSSKERASFTKFLDITTMSKISSQDQKRQDQIRSLEQEIKSLKMPDEPVSAERLFENKVFNQIKQKLPHLSTRDIQDLIVTKWNCGISDAERAEFHQMAEQARKSYFQLKEDAKVKENQLRAQIHLLEQGGQNDAIKPTGKLRFLTAYRFFRREEIPKVKERQPQLEGRQRHHLVKQKWKKMSQDEKFPFVLMSRADEERAKYASKIAQIRNNLLAEVGVQHPSHSMVNDVFTRIQKVISDNQTDDGESSCSSCEVSPDPRKDEESKEESADLSLSLINRQIGATSEEASSIHYSEDIRRDGFRQTDLKDYFKK